MPENGQRAVPAKGVVRLQWGVTIPLRDGVRLNATLYLPPLMAEPSPVIVTLTPYVGQTYHGRGMYFAARGYPFLAVDVRGRGNSEGSFQPNINETADGHDVVEWVANQSYCNGKVAMWGGSYGGYVQWAAARAFPRHLCAIAPVAAPYVGLEFPMWRNVWYPYIVRWLTLVAGRTSQERIFYEDEEFWRRRFTEAFEAGIAFRDLDTYLGLSSAVFQEWLRHPCQDTYWDAYNPTAEEYGRMSLPVLSITGAYDGDQSGALKHYREHVKHASPAAADKHHLVIGPWDHSGTRSPCDQVAGLELGKASQIDLNQLHLEWYDWILKSGPKPSFLEGRVAYYVMGAEQWRFSETLEAITIRTLPLFLRSDGSANRLLRSGSLGAGGAAGPADSYIYDPADLSVSAIENQLSDRLSTRPIFPTDNLTDQWPLYSNDGKHLVYHSEPLDSELEISGFFRFTAWIAIDCPDTDFAVNIYAVDRRGRSVLLAADRLRARYRQSLRQETLITTTDPLLYEFDHFNFISRLLDQGSRLRLTLGPVNSIHSQKNYNSGKAVGDETRADARQVTVKLFHDPAHPSVLHVPVGIGRDQRD